MQQTGHYYVRHHWWPNSSENGTTPSFQRIHYLVSYKGHNAAHLYQNSNLLWHWVFPTWSWVMLQVINIYSNIPPGLPKSSYTPPKEAAFALSKDENS